MLNVILIQVTINLLSPLLYQKKCYSASNHETFRTPNDLSSRIIGAYPLDTRVTTKFN